MMLTSILYSSLVFAGPDSTPSETTLKMEGKPGIKIFGFCVSTEGPEEKKFEGVTPTEVRFDTTIDRCRVSSEGDSSKIKVRVFQNRQFITMKEIQAPSAGIELVIPLGRKKK